MDNSNYFNTTRSTGPDLAKYEYKAKNQNEKVYTIFLEVQKSGVTALTASEVLELYPEPKPPLTSIRRALTTLSKTPKNEPLTKTKLEKTTRHKIGLFGRPEFYYKINLN